MSNDKLKLHLTGNIFFRRKQAMISKFYFIVKFMGYFSFFFKLDIYYSDDDTIAYNVENVLGKSLLIINVSID